MIKLIACVCLLQLLALPGVASVAPGTPVTPVYRPIVAPEISLAEMRAIVKDSKTLIFDARKSSAYSAGHIPGAHNLSPLANFSKAYALITTQIIMYKDQKIVVYCTNRWCPLSDALYAKLTALGYSHVVVFRDGFYGWEQAKLPIIKNHRAFKSESYHAATQTEK